MTRGVVIALRELMKQSEPNNLSKDLVAFIILSLEAIYNTIDPSVAAWEKRGYWVKADRFRMDWTWTKTLGLEMRQALIADDWSDIARISILVAQKLNTIQVSDRHRMGSPWIGAWDQLEENS
jgi:hypothetical protein